MFLSHQILDVGVIVTLECGDDIGMHANREVKKTLLLTYYDPKGSLGCQLVNTDKGSDDHMFLPGYAVIGKLLKGETVARKFDVRVGDVIVAVNGTGYRRFAPDYKEADVEYLNKDEEKVDVTLDNAVVAAGEAYNQLLSKIKAIKAAAPDPPLILTLERYGGTPLQFMASILGGTDNNVRIGNSQRIYKIFEPNYPETLFKMVMFPVSSMVGLTARSLLSFVNEKTQSKFLITNSLDKVCEELGWEKRDVDDCGGIKEFMEKHEKVGDSFLF
ncbi:expressed unknown protein [Seminavis robusta]|uniref:PDZ domain-containing protein n=1 Tax=Seminavis robusta TaxID=568900 RepID=A0A9N8HMI8_9STRA|nr:expressed unknown protein [Seminavis robusta]|eukprot:Sro1122_g243580.1 n/a (273) ;mRNA; r:33441-35087